VNRTIPIYLLVVYAKIICLFYINNKMFSRLFLGQTHGNEEISR